MGAESLSKLSKIKLAKRRFASRSE
jgi:hypothetical protein